MFGSQPSMKAKWRPGPRKARNGTARFAPGNQALSGTAKFTPEGPPPGVTPRMPGGAARPATAAAPPAPSGPGPSGTLDPFAIQAGDSPDVIRAKGTYGSQYGQATNVAKGKADAAMFRYGVQEVTDPAIDAPIVDKATGRRFRLDLAGNPYSDAANLQRMFEQRRTGDLNQAAGMGTVLDSSYGAAQNETALAEGNAFSQLGEGFIGELGGIEAGKYDAFKEAVNGLSPHLTAHTQNTAQTVKPGIGTKPGDAPAAGGKKKAKARKSGSHQKGTTR